MALTKSSSQPLHMSNMHRQCLSQYNHNNKKKILVKINKKFYRLTNTETVCGDSSLARKKLNWNPSVTFLDLINKMVKFDINKILYYERRR